MVYILIVVIVTVIIVSVLAVRPTPHERHVAFIRNHSLAEGWKIRLLSEDDIQNYYQSPVSESVVCYSRHHDESTRQASFLAWEVRNQSEEGLLSKNYIYNDLAENKPENSNLEEQDLSLIKTFFEKFGETVYAIENRQTVFKCCWNEKISKSDLPEFLTYLEQITEIH